MTSTSLVLVVCVLGIAWLAFAFIGDVMQPPAAKVARVLVEVLGLVYLIWVFISAHPFTQLRG